jgi:hypothetical protein
MKLDNLIEDKARSICAVIKATNTDDRGLLFLAVADQLTLDAQGFTAELFRIIGTRYGIPSNGGTQRHVGGGGGGGPPWSYHYIK